MMGAVEGPGEVRLCGWVYTDIDVSGPVHGKK